MPNDMFNPRSLYGTCIGRLPLDKSELSYKQAAKLRAHETTRFWFNYLCKRALSSRYEIIGLPEHCDTRLSLSALLWANRLALIETPVGFKAFMGANGSTVTEAGYTTDGYAYTCNGDVLPLKLYVPGEPEYVPDVAAGEYRACMIYESFGAEPFSLTVMEFAQQLADTWQKMEVARKNSATPYVIATDENGLSSVKATLNQRDNNQEVIVLNFGFDVTKGNLFPIQDAMKGLGVFEAHMEYLLNKFDTLCGIPNNPVVRKKERVNSAEIEASDAAALADIEDTIESLNYYFGFANQMMGTSITVKRREYNAGDVRRMGEDTGPGDPVRDGGRGAD